ncbi:LamG-like jellyroll fold domain-containing protein [Streptomyces sp. HSW2009]|uniref:LamG-like jellyroll fold domain-containing protein n=1 Tax=Streptomyces sp. HSW2009 TaxID=3142890 RepID=UPI0032EC14D5
MAGRRRLRGVRGVVGALGVALAVGLLPAGSAEANGRPAKESAASQESASVDGRAGAGVGADGPPGARKRDVEGAAKKRSAERPAGHSADRSGGAAPASTGTASSTDTAPTESAALALARRTGARVEVTSLRTETSEVFATPGGELEAREHVRPVRVRDGAGWRPVDTTLHRSPDGTVVPGGTAVDVAFSGGGTAPMARLRRAGRELALSWPKPLPAPRLAAEAAVYPEVLPGVDLRLTAEVDGFSQLLVVKSAEAAASKELAELRLRIAADGVTVREAPGGALEAVDHGAGNAVFEAPQPVMWDSSGTQPARAGNARTAGATIGRSAASRPTNSRPAANSRPGSSNDDTSNNGTTSRSAAAEHGTTNPGTTGPTPRTANSTTAPTPRTDTAPVPAPGSAGGGRPAPVGVEVGGGGSELVLTPDAELLTGADTVYPVYIDPQWYSPRASSWTVASQYWAGTPQWKFNGDPDAGLGYCGWAYCKPEDTKRLFYQIPSSRFTGRSVLSAEFVVRETHAASCDAREVQLWRTKAISSATTWNSQNASGFWADHLRSKSFAYGADGCAAADAEFEVAGVVRQAAEQGWPSITFGLRASNEGDRYGWKRFADDAYLRVKYNRRPTQLRTAQLTSDPGGTCQPADRAVRVRSLPTVRVNHVTDPDGDSVGVQFQATWDAGDGQGWKPRWTSATSTRKRSGSDFSTRLPASLPKNKRVDWHVRVWDGAQWSPWSYDGSAHGCNLVLDTSVPAGPTISSGQYPASDPENPEDPWRDGVGRYGTFAIESATPDVVRYWFGVNEQPSSKHTLNTSGGGAKSLRFLPTRPGVNFITAQAFDAAGNGSEPRTYSFRVRAGQPPPLPGQPTAPPPAPGGGGGGGGGPAGGAGGARAGTAGVTGGGLHLDGTDDYAATASPVLNTGKSFTVAAWAKLPAGGVSGTPVVLAQAGTHASGYELYYSSASGGWVFLRHTGDAATGNGVARAAQAPCPAADTGCPAGRLGTWTHLAGVFDHPAGELRLYVNGKLAGTAAYRDPWDARGATYLGVASHYGSREGHFTGDLDEAQLFDYQLSDAQLGTLAARQPVTSGGRPAKVVWNLDEDATAPAVTGRGQRVAGTAHGGPTLGAPGVAGTALTLDGTDDHVRTGQPVLDTHQSFALSLWARLPRDRGDRSMVAVSQAGSTLRGFELYHSPTLGWVFLRAGADDPNAPVTRAAQRPCPETQPTCAGAGLGEWAHVVAAYDYDVGELKLYVNGALKATEPFTTPWLARGQVSLGAAQYADGPGGFFRGDLDEVRLYDRVVTDDEVRQLFRQRPLVKGRWKLDAATGTPATSPDESAARRPLTLASGARIGPGWVDGGALLLDGKDDHAATGGTPVDTAASFTVAGWAQAAAVPDGPATVLSIEGDRRSAVTVRWVPGPGADSPGRWQVTLPATDADGAAVTTVQSGSFVDVRDWNHLALVYDGFADQLRLYVNGQPEALVCPDTDGDGSADDATCTNRVSWADNALSFAGTKALQVGRAKTAGAFGEYWPGAVDDVWAFQGALSDEQLAWLAEARGGVPTEVPQG